MSKEIVAEVIDLFEEYSKVHAENREEQLLDMKFVGNEHWTADELRIRTEQGRPSFVFNRIKSTLQVVANEMRENLPAIEVSPNGDGADVDTAEAISGLIRGIEQESNASTAYSNAGFYQTAIGEGYFRIVSRYIDEMSFEQELLIKPIDNPFTVLFDPASVEPDGKDQDKTLIVRDMSPAEYKAKYGESELAKALSDSKWSLKGLRDWANGTNVRVIEYWKREYKTKKIYQVQVENLLTGEKTIEVTDTKPSDAELDVAYNLSRQLETLEAVLLKKIISNRDTSILEVKQYICNGLEVLDETTWPGRFIPIIPVRGDALYINGKRVIQGLVRTMRDPQKVYNIETNLQIETVALAPKAPFIGYPGQFEGFEDDWETLNTANHAYLQVNPYTLPGGGPAGLPQRMNMEPAIQAVAATRAGAAEDLKATSGVYDASLGNRQGEESGKAILARQQQAQTSNWAYQNNVKRAIKHAGRILVDIIPRFYDTPRMVKILKPSGESELVAINGYANSEVLGDDKIKKHDLTVGKYDVVVTAGKSYSTRRQESVDSMLELARLAPDKAALFMDLLVKDMDWPGSQQIAKRLKANLAMQSPGLLEATDETDDGIDDQVKAAMAIKKSEEYKAGLEHAIQIAENLKNEIALVKQENQNLRLKNQVDIEKAKLEYDIKLRELELQEQIAIQDTLKFQAEHKVKMEQVQNSRMQTEIHALNSASAIADKLVPAAPEPKNEQE